MVRSNVYDFYTNTDNSCCDHKEFPKSDPLETQMKLVIREIGLIESVHEG